MNPTQSAGIALSVLSIQTDKPVNAKAFELHDHHMTALLAKINGMGSKSVRAEVVDALERLFNEGRLTFGDNNAMLALNEYAAQVGSKAVFPRFLGY